ncbi:MAG: hypothetical protein ABIJ09_25800 [Pseudomonadota bacterium]
MRLRKGGSTEEYFIDGGLSIRKKVPANELVGTGPGVEVETRFDIGDVVNHQLDGEVSIRSIRWSRSRCNEREDYDTYSERTRLWSGFNRKAGLSIH